MATSACAWPELRVELGQGLPVHRGAGAERGLQQPVFAPDRVRRILALLQLLPHGLEPRVDPGGVALGGGGLLLDLIVQVGAGDRAGDALGEVRIRGAGIDRQHIGVAHAIDGERMLEHVERAPLPGIRIIAPGRLAQHRDEIENPPRQRRVVVAEFRHGIEMLAGDHLREQIRGFDDGNDARDARGIDIHAAELRVRAERIGAPRLEQQLNRTRVARRHVLLHEEADRAADHGEPEQDRQGAQQGTQQQGEIDGRRRRGGAPRDRPAVAARGVGHCQRVVRAGGERRRRAGGERPVSKHCGPPTPSLPCARRSRDRDRATSSRCSSSRARRAGAASPACRLRHGCH